MDTCNLCKKVEGDVVRGKKIKLSDFAVCTVCSQELEKLEDLYRNDFGEKTGEEIKGVVPWPAFKEFSWPPYSAVIISGWEYHKHEFGMVFSDNFIISGRRSYQSMENKALDTMHSLSEELENTDDGREKMKLRRELKKCEKRLDKIEKLMASGERDIFTIPLEKITDLKEEVSPFWITIKLRYTRHKETFLGGKKKVTEQEYFIFSRIYEEVADFLVSRVKELGGNVATTTDEV